MQSRKSWFGPLIASGILQCLMAAAHFGLQYEWRFIDAGNMPAHLRWALFTLNFSWAVLVLAVGMLTIYAARQRADENFVRRSVLAVGAFWAIHGLYVLMSPMPLPARLAWIAAPILAFPATLVLLQWLPLAATRSASKRSPEEVPAAITE